MRFDPSIVKVKQSSVVSQIVSSPVVLSWLVCIILLTDVVQLTLNLKMIPSRVVEMSVTVNNNSPMQDYVHPDDQTQANFKKYEVQFFSVNSCDTFSQFLPT